MATNGYGAIGIDGAAEWRDDRDRLIDGQKVRKEVVLI